MTARARSFAEQGKCNHCWKYHPSVDEDNLTCEPCLALDFCTTCNHLLELSDVDGSMYCPLCNDKYSKVRERFVEYLKRNKTKILSHQ